MKRLFPLIKINIIVLFIRMCLFNWIIMLIQFFLNWYIFFHKNKLFIYDLKYLYFKIFKNLFIKRKFKKQMINS